MSWLSKTAAAGYCRQRPESTQANQRTCNQHYKFAADILEVTIHSLAKNLTNGSPNGFSQRTIPPHGNIHCPIDLLPAIRF